MTINFGDIIIVENLVWEQDHFHRVRNAWKVDDINNQGKIHAHDAHGKRKLIHALDRPPCYPYIVKVISA